MYATCLPDQPAPVQVVKSESNHDDDSTTNNNNNELLCVCIYYFRLCEHSSFGGTI